MKTVSMIFVLAIAALIYSCTSVETEGDLNELLDDITIDSEMINEELAETETSETKETTSVAVEGAILISDVFADFENDYDAACKKYDFGKELSIQGPVQKVTEGETTKIVIATGEVNKIHKVTAYLKNNDDVSMLEEAGMFMDKPATEVVVTGKVTAQGQAGSAYNMTLDKASFEIVK